MADDVGDGRSGEFVANLFADAAASNGVRHDDGKCWIES